MNKSHGIAKWTGTRVRPIRVIAGLAVVAGALWVGSISLAAVVRKSAPERASSLSPHSPDVLATRSHAALVAGAMREARILATAALKGDATAIEAVQTMGILAQASGEVAQSGRWLNYAERLSRRELQTHLWAVEYFVARNDTIQVLRHYDLALRTSAQARYVLYPVLGAAIEDPEIGQGLLGRLAQRPLWSIDFLSFLASDGSISPMGAVRFLTAAKQMGLDASSTSLKALVSRSLQAQQPEAAWEAYRLQRPDADRRGLRDPDFAGIPGNATLFDWVFTDSGGILAQVVIDGDKKSQLEVNVGAGSAGLVAQQVQMLPVGNYKLEIIVDEAVVSDSSLYWSMRCNGENEIGKSPVRSAGVRYILEMNVEVPKDCVTQLLQLNAYAGDAPEDIRAKFSSVKIDPARP